MLKKQKVVIFDFDGTLSAKDANAQFMKYCFKHSLRPWLFLPMVLFGVILSFLIVKIQMFVNFQKLGVKLF